MNIKDEIAARLEQINSEEVRDILEGGVMVHLDRAEYYFHQADKYNDEHYYNDVVYRTNQAYEGMLKTAYLSFTGGAEETNLLTYQLENFFEENQVFNEKTKTLFEVYRRTWRNPSIHDHELFFNRDDAWLAIVMVSTFIYILLDQIVEKFSAEAIKLNISKIKDALTQDNAYFTDNTTDVVIERLKKFHEIPKDDIIVEKNISQIIGALKGYLEQTLRGLEVITHYKGEDVLGYQPDIIINDNQNSILIVEVKSEFTKQKLDFGYRQIKDYLSRTTVKQGVLYFYTDNTDAQYQLDKEMFIDNEIIILKPE